MADDFHKEKYVLTDMLLDGDMTKKEIADFFSISPAELNKRIKSYNLDWVKAKKRKMSRGQSAIVDILKKILPNEQVDFEYHVGERLLVDVYVPSYRLGIEYHGRQHFEYSAFFHGSKANFDLAKERDERKIELCREQGITLVVFRYNDDLTEDSVFDRILDGIRTQPLPTVEDVEVSEAEIESARLKKDIVEKAKRRRKSSRKEWKARKDLDHEAKREREAFKRKVKQARRKKRRDDYVNSGD